MKKIFVLGSLNIDLVFETMRMPKIGETVTAGGFFVGHGGKGANQATAAAKCGGHVIMFGAVGNDAFGKELIASLKKAGVNIEHVQKIKGSSGKAIIIVEKADNRIIVDKGANAFVDSRKIIEELIKLALPGDIIAAQLETPQQVVFEVFEQAKKVGMVTTLNPAPASKLIDELYKYVDIITPNETEAEILTGIYPKNEKDYLNIAQTFLKRGIPQTIITLGERGSVYINAEKMTVIPAYKVDAVDTTAAGDSFIGGLCSSLALGNDILDSIRFGTAVSALTVTKKGAQKSIPDIQEIRRFIADIQMGD